MGFSLNEWVLFWAEQFNVLVRTFGANQWDLEPLEEKYTRIISDLEEKAADPEEGKREKKILDAIQGTKIVQYASEEFWFLKAIQQLNLSPSDWKAMSLRDKGKYVAFVQQDNRIETLRAYARETKREIRKPAKPPSRRAPRKPRRRRG